MIGTPWITVTMAYIYWEPRRYQFRKRRIPYKKHVIELHRRPIIRVALEIAVEMLLQTFRYTRFAIIYPDRGHSVYH